MALPVAVERVGSVTRVTFRVPEGMEVAPWYQRTVESYGTLTGPTVSTEVEAAFVTEVAGVIDAIRSPSPARTVPPTVGSSLPVGTFRPRGGITAAQAAAWGTVQGRTWSELVTAADAGLMDPALKMEFEAVQMALAQVSILREVVTGVRSRVVAPAGTAAGAFWGVLAVGAVIMAGAALDEYFDAIRTADALRAAADERVARARIAQAGEDFRARLAEWRSTGSMAAPSAIESAAAAEVQRRARGEWDGFWQAAGRAVAGAGKGAMLAAGGVLLVLLLSGSKR